MNARDLLVALFVVGAVLLSWPFLTIVNRPRALLGVPLLVVLGLYGGKLTAAARHADMDNRNLWEKMLRHGLRARAAGVESLPESPSPVPGPEGA